MEKDLNDCKMRFHSIFPESKKYSEMHDFKFYELKIKHVRWIGGFGKIAWLDKKTGLIKLLIGKAEKVKS